MPKVLVPIADGTEEIEAVTIIDVLRRAGAEVTVAAVGDPPGGVITASRGVRIVADCPIAHCVGEVFDLIALPGGMPGAERLRDSPELTGLLTGQKAAGRPLAAICAAPAVVLEAHGLLGAGRATAHPAFFDRLPADRASEDGVVIDGGCITSRGPGTAIPFALTLVKILFGEETAREIGRAMVVDGW